MVFSFFHLLICATETWWGAMQRSSDAVLQSGRRMAFVGAGLICVAALLDALLFFGVSAGPPPDPLFFEFDLRVSSRLTALDPHYLSAVWAWNVRAFPSLLASDFLLSCGLFFLAYVSLSLIIIFIMVLFSFFSPLCIFFS